MCFFLKITLRVSDNQVISSKSFTKSHRKNPNLSQRLQVLNVNKAEWESHRTAMATSHPLSEAEKEGTEVLPGQPVRGKTMEKRPEGQTLAQEESNQCHGFHQSSEPAGAKHQMSLSPCLTFVCFPTDKPRQLAFSRAHRARGQRMDVDSYARRIAGMYLMLISSHVNGFWAFSHFCTYGCTSFFEADLKD